MYLLGPLDWIQEKNAARGTGPRQMPRSIALFLLASYVVLLALTGIVAAFRPLSDTAWVELFKSGFLLLGGGLTTVIGYYFGARETQEAVKSEREAQQARGESITEQSPTEDEDALRR